MLFRSICVIVIVHHGKTRNIRGNVLCFLRIKIMAELLPNFKFQISNFSVL